MTQPYVKQTTDNGIATIEFFHPAHNSLPGDITDIIAADIAAHSSIDQEHKVRDAAEDEVTEEI